MSATSSTSSNTNNNGSVLSPILGQSTLSLERNVKNLKETTNEKIKKLQTVQLCFDDARADDSFMRTEMARKIGIFTTDLSEMLSLKSDTVATIFNSYSTIKRVLDDPDAVYIHPIHMDDAQAKFAISFHSMKDIYKEDHPAKRYLDQTTQKEMSNTRDQITQLETSFINRMKELEQMKTTIPKKSTQGTENAEQVEGAGSSEVDRSQIATLTQQVTDLRNRSEADRFQIATLTQQGTDLQNKLELLEKMFSKRPNQ